jgi:hypothetical protein
MDQQQQLPQSLHSQVSAVLVSMPVMLHEVPRVVDVIPACPESWLKDARRKRQSRQAEMNSDEKVG